VTGFGVSPEELEACDAGLGAGVAAAWAAVGRLRDEGSALLARGWRGPAADAFRLGWAEWLAGAGLVLEALDELAALIGTAGTSYAGAEQAVRSSFAGGAG
jgi:uncharacterized protein YukE